MKKGIFIILCLSVVLISCSKKDQINNTQWWTTDKKVSINISDVWNITHGDENVIIGIIDSGIDISCDGINKSLYINPNEIPNNGIDDDGNGYVDDKNGWNFYDNSNEIYSNFASDYHGTMIAGILTDKNYGIAKNIKYLPLKCFRGTEGSIDDVVLAIEYAYDLGVRIFNCSWDTNQYNDKLFDIIKSYPDAIFVCSGGKNYENLDTTPVYPACYNLPNIICVGGIDTSGDVLEFSGYGKKIDIYAPGANIYSLMPENTYNYSEGTSLSVAFVSGAIALAKSIDSSISCEDIKACFGDSYNDSTKLQELDVYKLCFGK